MRVVCAYDQMTCQRITAFHPTKGDESIKHPITTCHPPNEMTPPPAGHHTRVVVPKLQGGKHPWVVPRDPGLRLGLDPELPRGDEVEVEAACAHRDGDGDGGVDGDVDVDGDGDGQSAYVPDFGGRRKAVCEGGVVWKRAGVVVMNWIEKALEREARTHPWLSVPAASQRPRARAAAPPA